MTNITLNMSIGLTQPQAAHVPRGPRQEGSSCGYMMTQNIPCSQVPQSSCRFLPNLKLWEILTCRAVAAMTDAGDSAHVAALTCLCEGQTQRPRLGLAHAGGPTATPNPLTR